MQVMVSFPAILICVTNSVRRYLLILADEDWGVDISLRSMHDKGDDLYCLITSRGLIVLLSISVQVNVHKVETSVVSLSFHADGQFGVAIYTNVQLVEFIYLSSWSLFRGANLFYRSSTFTRL